ncbi:hypothetical protein Tco_0970696 [Tanacetum coccineum]
MLDDKALPYGLQLLASIRMLRLLDRRSNHEQAYRRRYPYVEQLDQGGMRIPFSTFFLAVISLNISVIVSLFRVFYKWCKQVYWFSFENKSGGRVKKCFKEITSSLKGWKKKFFLIDRRAIPDGMPWRHIDTDVRDDFPISYNEIYADRIAEHVILLHKRPQPLLYMCELTMDCRHPELSYIIKDPEGQGDPIPDNERPPVRTTALFPTGFVIPEKNARQKSVEKPDQKIAEAREKKEKQALAKANAKRTGEASWVASKKKKARKNAGLTGSESEEPAPPLVIKTLEERFVQEENWTGNVDLSDAHIFHSIHKEDNDEDADGHCFIPEWGLRSNLCISSYCTCKEMILHLATPAKDEVLLSLTNYDVKELAAQLARSKVNRQSIIRDFIPTVVGRLHTSVEYRRSLAVAISLSYTAGWLGDLEDLMNVCPDVPIDTAADKAGDST